VQSVFGNTRWSSMRFLEDVLRDRRRIRERCDYCCRVSNTCTLILKGRYPWRSQSKVRKVSTLVAIGTMWPMTVLPVRGLM
jgi:hypothetical protein